MCVCQADIFNWFEEKPCSSGFVVNKASEVNFLSEANLWFIASRLNNSTITITFVVIYKLCATQQRGSMCVRVCVGGVVSLYLSMCVCVSLSFIEGLFVLLPSCSCSCF